MAPRTRKGVVALREALEALWQAISEQNLEGMQSVLRERRDDLRDGALDTRNEATERHDPALIMCCRSGFLAGVEPLLDAGANIESTNIGEATALYIAAQEGFETIVGVLIARGSQIDAVTDNGASPLIMAASKGNAPVVALLLEHNARIDLVSKNGATPLLVAASKGNPHVVALLLEHKARVDLADHKGVTPLLMAASKGNAPVVALLLEHNAEVDLADHKGVTPLSLAAYRGNAPFVALLLEHNAEVDLADSKNRTPLMVAAWRGLETVVSLLLDEEPDINLVNENGLNALHYAAYNDRPEVCALLIAKGLDPATEMNLGRSALSHYGSWLDNANIDRPPLTDEEKEERVTKLEAARDAYLLQKLRDDNWERRAAFMHALVGSGIRLTAAQTAEHALIQAASDKSAKIPPIPRKTKAQNIAYLNKQVFGAEGYVRKVTEYI